ncbi:MAG: UDP-glucose 4-epimerase GalE [Rhodospirillales bacterium]|nr:UDP-glucose 4-epimerase GalE [Rhodospirillales bacterium]
MATVLVTGGAGYVGSHACKALAAAGHHPVVYDSLAHGHRDFVRWGPLEQGDIADSARLDAVITQYRPDAVMHFAALIFVGESVIDPARYYLNNVAGTLNLLEAVRRNGIGAMVFSSTCAIYGVPVQVPIPDGHPIAPINPYGAGKAVVEGMLRDYAAAYGLRYAALRYFNAAGADPGGEIGERHDPENHAIPLAVLAAMGRGTAFQILGTDYETPDGTAIRDYIHVNDLAAAHVAAIDHLLKDGDSLRLNLGTGIGTSVRQLVAAVERVAGHSLNPIEKPRRAGDSPILVADARAARAILGWQPRWTAIDDIVATAWAWHAKDCRQV